MANIRDFGDGKQLVVHVEKVHSAHNRIKEFKGMTLAVSYYNLKDKGKHEATDFYFPYANGGQKRDIKQRLENILG